ncbi:MAG TPA: methyltransferase domain-containing protein [Rhodopila sp.]|jgi:ubiquinone/menaquinone biosynthesis C-methylase UbiE|uniref:class I SAM-dependent methyltransferase n=1 Tax=Rhodopila sp. TaxID=2480087 RepID=UPI002C46950C|nr:methyltransferase domain-containing protein [Rhodopila sp.]HVY14561.1 methyltransferase domain-containing protein [Rhodopila sp.]
MAQTGKSPMTETVEAQWAAAAEGWDAQASVLDAWLSGPTRTMLDLAGIEPGSRVLDIAAGAGGQTIVLAQRVGRQGRILATDLSPFLVERLRGNVARAGLRMVEARAADAQMPLTETDAFDAAICRLGLMLMAEPPLCLSATHAALKSGGRFSAMVFAGPDANPCIRILMATAARHAGVPPRDPFAPGGLLSLGRPGYLDQLFRAVGFSDVSTFQIEAPFRLPSVDDYIAFLRAAAAPVIALLSHLDPDAQDAAWADIRRQLAAFDVTAGWNGPNTLLVTTGRK